MKKRIRNILIGLNIVTIVWGIGYMKIALNNNTVLNEKLFESIESLDNVRDSSDTTINNLSEQLEETKKQLYELKKEHENIKYSIDKLSWKPHFNPNNISETTGSGIYRIKKALKGTALENLSETFVLAENLYGVNSIFLASIVAHESGWITSPVATSNNNLTGNEMYSSASRGRVFDSKEDCILNTAKLIREQYLNKDGKYYNGLSVYSINTEYCLDKNNNTDYKWSHSIINIAEDNFLK